MKNLGILIYEDVQPMDVFGPWEVFSIWKSTLNCSIDMHLIAPDNKIVQCDGGVKLEAHYTLSDAPNLDYLIVPGGRGRQKASKNEAILQYIHQQGQSCEYILSVCTGMFLLYYAGLLDNKKVTTYWRAMPELRELDNINVVEERVVKSGKIWTAGGISSGIDLALALIAEISGRDTAGQVQLLFEYFPEQIAYCNTSLKETLPDYSNTTRTMNTKLPEYIVNFINSSTS
ncbi:DJ-1/PfpI family protein [Cysteiniphilum marinum]|uniref:DJ-1/PfpI family protein n=1 Tax=Cysteiniphilum marinum TaxID=2774191 RepID=UPI00193B9EFD|nr:DJ-1/PfpI family protein [Cysteiniphilum marinum]